LPSRKNEGCSLRKNTLKLFSKSVAGIKNGSTFAAPKKRAGSSDIFSRKKLKIFFEKNLQF